MKHLLSIEALDAAELREILALAAEMKATRGRHTEHPLRHQCWVMMFSKSSTRTRVSFEVGIRELGGDVIFLAEAGEEGSTRIGIEYMVNQHWGAIDAEFCYAEGGSVTRTGGEVKFASIQTVEKIPRAITVTSKGVAGHGSVPLETNALAHLGEAVGKIAAWTPPMRINETTAAYFKRLATVSSPEDAKRYHHLSHR